jgi:CRP-like cAMP-binding protein
MVAHLGLPQRFSFREDTVHRPTLTTLRAIGILSRLPEGLLTSLLDHVAWESHRSGYCFVRQHELSRRVVFILSGYVRVMRGSTMPPARIISGVAERRRRPRQDAMVALLGPGGMIGEAAALLDARESASVVALTDCQAVSIPAAQFTGLIRQSPDFALAVAAKMAERQIDVERQVELMRGQLEGRIHALLRHCQSIGLDVASSLTNTEIACMVGATRVAVSPIMARLSGERDPGGVPERTKKAG